MNSKEKWWTPSRITRMLNLRHQGHAFSAIARMLGDTTKNAVLSKYKRMGIKEKIPPREKPKRLKQHVVVQNVPIVSEIEPSPPPAPNTDKQDAVRKMVSMYDKVAELNNLECKYPIGELSDPDFTFCFAPATQHGRSYCEKHHRACHTAPRPR